MAANREHLGLVLVQARHHFVVIGYRRNWLLGNFLDHISFLQLGYSAIRIDIRHHDAVNSIGQIQLSRHIRSEITDPD